MKRNLTKSYANKNWLNLNPTLITEKHKTKETRDKIYKTLFISINPNSKSNPLETLENLKNKKLFKKFIFL